MFRYEMLILASPEITKDEESNLEKQIEKLINEAKGSIIEFDRWGKYRLAYPVQGNDYGVYFLMRFEIEDKNVLQELERMFYVKFNAIVMRSMNTKLDIDQSLEYKKPPSLEDTPKKPITFLEEKELRPRRAATSDKKEEILEFEELELEEVPEGIEKKEEKEVAEMAPSNDCTDNVSSEITDHNEKQEV